MADNADSPIGDSPVDVDTSSAVASNVEYNTADGGMALANETGDSYDPGLAYADGAGNGADIDSGYLGDDGQYGDGGGSGADLDLGAGGPFMAPPSPSLEDSLGSARVANEDIMLSVPAFANAENRALNEKLIQRNQQLARAQSETLEHQERVRVMQEHLKNVRLELIDAQKVLESRGKELKTEDHLANLAERAVGRMKTDSSALEQDAEAVAEQLASVQANIFKNTERLEKFRSDMNWKAEELEKWAQHAKINEQNLLALEEYTRADEQKVRDLTRELEQLTARVAAKRSELDSEVTDTNAKQIELDKCAEEFKALHKERQDLIKQWQSSLDAIKQRDEDISKAGGRYSDIKMAAGRRRQLIQEHERRLGGLESENKSIEIQIEGTHRQVGDFRDQMNVWTSRVSELRERVELLKTEVSAAASDLVRRRAENENFRISAEEKEHKVERLKMDLENTKQRLKESKEAAMSVEEALLRKEEYLKREAGMVERAEKEVTQLKEAEYRARETVTALKSEQEGIQGEIAATKRTIKNLADKVTELDAHAVKQQEHVYAAEFQIQQMERKIGRAKGEVSDEEKVKLQAKVTELQGELEEARTTERSLQGEAKTVKNAQMNAVRRAEELAKQVSEVQARIDELLLQTRSGEDGLRKAVREKEESMVAHDLLKLEVRRLRDALSNKTDQVFGLENRAAQLEMSIESRKKEVEAHRAVQRAAAKLAEEERHKLALDVAERSQRITTLKAKYETLCARLRGGDGEDDGQEKSQAYFVLKAAQRREELQREGDELDRLIKKAERETKALAHTLQYLNTRNDSYRSAFHRVGDDSDDVSVVRALEAQANEAQDQLFKRKRQLNQLVSDIDENNRRLAGMGDRISGLAAQLQQLEDTYRRVDAERQAQLQAVHAAVARLDAAKQKHRRARAARNNNNNSNGSGPTPDEIAFTAQGMRDTNASVLFTLGQLAVEYPQLKPALASLVQERGLRMPGRPPTRVPMAAAAVAGAAPTTLGVITAGAQLPSSSYTSGAGSASTPSLPQVPVSPLVVPGSLSARGPSGIPSKPGPLPLPANARRPSSAGSEQPLPRAPTPTAKGAAGRLPAGRGAAAVAAVQASQAGGLGVAAVGLGISGRPLSGQSVTSGNNVGLAGGKPPSANVRAR